MSGLPDTRATRLDWGALVRIFSLSLVLGALLSSLYLGKCMLGIDVIAGPSPLHNLLYWIVDGHAGQWREYLSI